MPTSRVVLVLYAFAATINVMASARQLTSLGWATTPLLMPLLAILVIFAAQEAGRGVDRWLLAGLLLATAGDLALLASGGVPRAIGMAFLVGCQFCYLAAFVRTPVRRRPGRWPLAALGGALLVAADTLHVTHAAAFWTTLATVLGQVLVVTALSPAAPSPAAPSPAAPSPATPSPATPSSVDHDLEVMIGAVPRRSAHDREDLDELRPPDPQG